EILYGPVLPGAGRAALRRQHHAAVAQPQIRAFAGQRTAVRARRARQGETEDALGVRVSWLARRRFNIRVVPAKAGIHPPRHHVARPG
ncbi:hypothetical protein E4T56_gene440, partial [Termitomyces sp. T112]